MIEMYRRVQTCTSAFFVVAYNVQTVNYYSHLCGRANEREGKRMREGKVRRVERKRKKSGTDNAIRKRRSVQTDNAKWSNRPSVLCIAMRKLAE